MKHNFFLPGGAEAKRLKFHRTARFNDGGGGSGGATETPEQKLLAQIQEKVKTEIENRKYKNETEIQGLIKASIDTALNGLNLEALRSFDAKGIPESVTKIAAELEKIQNRPAASGGVTERRNYLKEWLDKKENMDKIEKVYNARNVGAEFELNVRAAIVMTSQNTMTEVIPDDILSSYSVDAFIKKRRPVEYIFDIASRRTVANITEYKTWLEEGTEDGAFAVIGEGIVKPLVSKTLIRNVHKYRKIAGKRVYTEEFPKFRQEAYNILEDLFNDQLVRNYAAVLVIDLIAAAALYAGTALDGQFVNPTDYHAIGAVAAQIESLDFFPDTIFINPQDKWRIALQQDSQGRFFLNIPQYTPDGTVVMMGFRVFVSNRIAVGTFILGEAKLYKIEDEPVKIRMGYGITVVGAGPVTSVEGDFDTNRFRIIAETFFHNYIGTNYTGSFVSGNFAAIKAVLQAP